MTHRVYILTLIS